MFCSSPPIAPRAFRLLWPCMPLVVAVLLAALLVPPPARAQFRELVDRLPRTANAIVILNMEKAKNSPLGKAEGWSVKVGQAFEAGISRVPRVATRFVLAAELDFQTMQPTWEVALMDTAQPLSQDEIIKQRRGIPDVVEKLPAVAMANNVILVQFAPTTFGAMGPANRQAVVRWVREVQSKSRQPLSPYLEKAAGYSDDAGTEIIMAVDLDGVFAWERVAKYLAKPEHEKMIRDANADVKTVTNLLAGIQGVRVGIRIGERPSGRVTVDFAHKVTISAPLAKRLLLTVLSDGGLRISDFDEWNVTVKETTVSLDGTLSLAGMRRLLSLIDSPASSESGSASDSGPSADPKSAMLVASRDHYKAVTTLMKDLKEDMKDLKSLSHSMVFFDKYAKKIENLPILNVDEEMLAFSGWVAQQVRDCAGSVRTMGIRSGEREAHTFGDLGPTVVGGRGAGAYGPYGGYGGYGVVYKYDPLSEVKGTVAARRVVKSEERAIMASDVHTIRDQLLRANADIRRKMTQKYQVEF
jgi:hypothetical protein